MRLSTDYRCFQQLVWIIPFLQHTFPNKHTAYGFGNHTTRDLHIIRKCVLHPPIQPLLSDFLRCPIRGAVPVCGSSQTLPPLPVLNCHIWAALTIEFRNLMIFFLNSHEISETSWNSLEDFTSSGKFSWGMASNGTPCHTKCGRYTHSLIFLAQNNNIFLPIAMYCKKDSFFSYWKLKRQRKPFHAGLWICSGKVCYNKR